MGTLSGTATFVSPLALGVSSKREELALSVLLVTVDSFFFFFFFFEWLHWPKEQTRVANGFPLFKL